MEKELSATAKLDAGKVEVKRVSGPSGPNMHPEMPEMEDFDRVVIYGSAEVGDISACWVKSGGVPSASQKAFAKKRKEEIYVVDNGTGKCRAVGTGTSSEALKKVFADFIERELVRYWESLL